MICIYTANHKNNFFQTVKCFYNFFVSCNCICYALGVVSKSLKELYCMLPPFFLKQNELQPCTFPSGSIKVLSLVIVVYKKIIFGLQQLCSKSVLFGYCWFIQVLLLRFRVILLNGRKFLKHNFTFLLLVNRHYCRFWNIYFWCMS